MTDDNPVKAKFTLDPAYRSFMPGKTTLKFETLSPLTDVSCGCAALVMMVLLPVFLLVITALLYKAGEDVLFQLDGRDITASVTTCEMRRHAQRIKTPFVTYTYEVNGSTYSGDSPLPRIAFDCDRYPVGTPLPVRYTALNPSQSRVLMDGIYPPALESLLLDLFIVVCGIPFLLAIFYGGIRSVIQYRHSKKIYPRLAQEGILLEGEITAIRGEERGKSVKNYYVIVEYAFLSPGKHRLTGQVEAIRGELQGKELPPIGTPVTILYADDNAHVML